MSVHRVVWDARDERLNLVCEAAPDARCKWEPTCECETYSDLEQDGDGSWSHGAFDGPMDDEVRHQHSRPAHECHYRDWWHSYDVGAENGPDEAFWTYDDNDEPIPPPEGLIEFDWDGDYYTWDYLRDEDGNPLQPEKAEVQA